MGREPEKIESIGAAAVQRQNGWKWSMTLRLIDRVNQLQENLPEGYCSRRRIPARKETATTVAVSAATRANEGAVVQSVGTISGFRRNEAVVT